MFGHLGAKVGEQGRKMQQMTEKVGFLEACCEKTPLWHVKVASGGYFG